ncbi:MAG: PSD1 domain-containing protein [Acidobacteria bacterium]|nr:PSD1 domain-containing protein [Acidobacteriota bacterium]MBI3424065.1 PSD1 domain-containing protein [Acidobacteriota bacterium]
MMISARGVTEKIAAALGARTSLILLANPKMSDKLPACRRLRQCGQSVGCHAADKLAACRTLKARLPAESSLRVHPVKRLALCLLALLYGLPTGHAQQSPANLATAQTEFFEQRIRPLLAAHCYDCHADAAKGGLRVDTRAALLKGGQRGPAIVSGDPANSLLLQAVNHTHATLRMPKGGAKLSDAEIADLTRWIKGGAPWPVTLATKNEYLIKPEHQAFWSFQPVRRPAVPAVKGATNNPVDAFLLAELEAKGLSFNPPADKRTLLRRVTFDLTGLPPPPAEMEAFLADRAPDAYAKVVERLLASPHYGERWGRHWLDVARYSDTLGMIDAGRNLQGWFPFAYTYRDWVVRALNEDMPYDQFIVQQLAADKLPNNDRRNLAALGFVSLSRGGLNVNQHERLDDKIDVVSRGLLGLTVSCARCHNHKFDPIPTRDYYALYNIFSNTREPKQLPLLDPNAAVGGEFEAETKAEEKKIETDIQKKRAARFPKLKELYASAPELAKSLRFAAEARALPDSELPKYAQEKDYNVYLLRRWRTYLQQAKDNPVWAIWQRLSTLPAAEFKVKAVAVLTDQAANPLVRAAFKEPPASLNEAAETYGKLLAQYDKPETLTDAHVEALRQVIRGADSPLNFPFSDYEAVRLSTDKQNEDGSRRKLESLFLAQAYRGAPPRAQSVEDAETPQSGYVFLRGKPENKGEQVQPQFLQILAGPDRKPFTNGSGRLELAQAIADPRNPLTARVMVNRIWQHHFGNGLVRTPSDFGTRGEAPTHPALLDWLASTFMNDADNPQSAIRNPQSDGWSLKKLHRLLVLSRAYQQSSTDNAAARQRDPENKLLWHMNRRRLDIEELRDALLQASGKLDLKLAGLPASAEAWPFMQRRTLYSFIDRAIVPGDFLAFDFASPEAHSPQRYLTTVPQQALLLLNSPFVIEQARALLQRPEIATEKNPRRRIAQLYRLLYNRRPGAGELALALQFINEPANTDKVLLDNTYSQAWQYGQGELDEKAERVKTFKPFAWFLQGEWRNSAMPGDPRTSLALLNNKGGLIYEGKANALIRRWVAPFDGRVKLGGVLEQTFENGCRKCDGVQAHIVSSRNGRAGNWTARPEQTSTAVAEVAVQRGDTLDFVAEVSKGSAGNGFKWAVTIQRLAGNDAGSGETWDSLRDFRAPWVTPLTAWERYAQTLLAAAEFLVLD